MAEQKKQTTPVPVGIAGVLAYFIPVFGGLIFLFLEKENRLVRFHAVQSILLWIFFMIIAVFAGLIPFIGLILWLLMIVVWLFIMYQALMEREYKLPVIGKIARKQAFGSEE